MRPILALALVSSIAFVSSSPLGDNEPGKRLISFSETESKWLTQAEVEQLMLQNVHFMDITDHRTPVDRKINNVFAFPTTLRFASTAQAAFTRIDNARMETFLTRYIEFNNRYYTSDTGIAASDWLLSQVQDSIAANPSYGGQVTARQYAHSGWAQKSVIARIEGSRGSDEVLVLGAHLDSITSGAAARAPGADDDGSGTTTILEAFRVLLASGFVPRQSIEFQWYAAEEVGLRGSQDIATAYKAAGVNVIAMTQFDMTGYLSSNRRIGLVTDFTTAGLNTFLRIVIDGYLDYQWVNRQCGYACSDHASYYRQGYECAFPFEDSSNPNIHTIRDTLDYVNFDHVHQYVKLAVGYAIEIGEPTQ